MQASMSTKALCEPAGLSRSAVRAFQPVRCSAGLPRTRLNHGQAAAGSALPPLSRPARPSLAPAAPSSRQSIACRAVPNGKLISSTEVPAFIPRDDMMDQLLRWTMMEAGESGQRNFGMPMKIEPTYHEERLWGFNVAIFKEGTKLTDVGIMFDKELINKHEYVGRGEDGFPTMEGKVDEVRGRNIEIWKMDSDPVTEDLRSCIRAYCTALVAALNRYYAFGSVFVDDAQ